MKLWSKWVALWSQREVPTMLALIRIFVGVVLLWDFVEIGLHGLPDVMWTPQELGGLPSNVLQRKVPPEVFTYLDPSPELSWGLWGVIILCLVLLVLGVATPLVGVVLVLAYAQTALILPLSDRGIDLLLRNVLMVLIFSKAGATLSLQAKLKTGSWLGDAKTHPSWPRYLIALQLVVMYFMAGVQKTALTWTPLGGYNALYIILHDPHIARMDWAGMGVLDAVSPLLRLGTAATHIFEWGAPILVLAFWFRYTHERPGRLRAFFLRWDVRLIWVVIGAVLHLGIAIAMQLGVFAWAMLALFPAWFHPDEIDGFRNWWKKRRSSQT